MHIIRTLAAGLSMVTHALISALKRAEAVELFVLKASSV